MLLSDEEGIVKLTDFGSASMFVRGDTMNKTNGTPAFMCPEMCEAKPYRGRVADCWALGICLWNMVFGKPPFHGNTIVALYEAIRDKELEFPPETPVSDELKDLFIRCAKQLNVPQRLPAGAAMRARAYELRRCAGVFSGP